MSTLAIARRETGGWKWPLFMLAYMNTPGVLWFAWWCTRWECGSDEKML